MQLALDDDACTLVVVLASDRRHDLQPAASLLQWARTANPNCYEAWTYSAWQAFHACEPERALEHIAAADRLDPAPANGATTIAARCAAHLLAGRFAEAVEAGRSAVAYSPRMPHAHIFHTAVLGQSGDLAAAKQAAEALLRVQPGYTLRFAAGVLNVVRATRDMNAATAVPADTPPLRDDEDE